MWALAQLMKFLTPSTLNMRAPQASAAQSNYSTILKGDWDWDIKENKVFQVTNETSHTNVHLQIDTRHTYNAMGLVVPNSVLLGLTDTVCESKSPLWWSPHADDSLMVTADAVPGLDLSFLDEDSKGPVQEMLAVRIERRSPEQRKKTPRIIIHTQDPTDNSLLWEPSLSTRTTSSPQTTASSTHSYHDGYSPSLADCGVQWYKENWSAECFPASRVVGTLAPSSHMSTALVPINLGIMNLGGEVESGQSPTTVAIDGAPVRTPRVRSNSNSGSSSASGDTPPPGLSSRHLALLDGCCNSTKARPSTYGLTVTEICRQIESGEYFVGRMNA